MVHNRIVTHIDEKLIQEQAGFRKGKSCTGQILNMTQFIENGFEKKKYHWSSPYRPGSSL